jgi:hypothetical protein
MFVGRKGKKKIVPKKRPTNQSSSAPDSKGVSSGATVISKDTSEPLVPSDSTGVAVITPDVNNGQDALLVEREVLERDNRMSELEGTLEKIAGDHESLSSKLDALLKENTQKGSSLDEQFQALRDSFLTVSTDATQALEQVGALCNQVTDTRERTSQEREINEFSREEREDFIKRYTPGTVDLLRQEIAELKSQLTEKMEEASREYQRAEVLQGLEPSIKAREENLDQREERVRDLEKQLEEGKASFSTIKGVHRKFEELQQRYEELQGIKAGNDDVAELKAELSRYEQELDNVLGLLKDEESRVVAQKPLRERAEKSARLEADRNAIQLELQCFKDNEEQVQSAARKSMEEGIQLTKATTARLAKSNEEQEKLWQEVSKPMQRRIESYVEDIERSQATLRSRDDEIKKLQRANARFEGIEQDQKRIAQLKEERVYLEETKEQTQDEVADLRGTIAELDGKCRSLQATLEGGKEDLEKLNKQIDDLLIQQAEIRNPSEDPKQRYKPITDPGDDPLHVEYARSDDDTRPEVDEASWLTHVKKSIQNSGFVFNDRLIEAFHTSLKCGDWASLTALAGVSGTGKSELPRLYAAAGGMRLSMVSVLPDWDNKQELFGHFDYLSMAFKPQPLLRAMAQAQTPSASGGFDDGMLLVLLDEMNLARVELYFADLLSKLESRRGTVDEPYIEIDLGANAEPYRLKLSRNILFVGTMNDDETTHALSSKVLDRTNLIRFPSPRHLVAREKPTLPAQSRWLRAETWDTWKKDPAELDKDRHEKVMQSMQTFKEALDYTNSPIGHRPLQATLHYVANHPGQGQGGTGCQHAMEDQFLQKIVPRLDQAGLDPKSRDGAKCLQLIEEGIKKLGSDSLEEELVRSKEIDTDGIFQWHSTLYSTE